MPRRAPVRASRQPNRKKRGSPPPGGDGLASPADAFDALEERFERIRRELEELRHRIGELSEHQAKFDRLLKIALQGRLAGQGVPRSSKDDEFESTDV